MNLKSTAFFFALLLGMLWLFGLMLTYKKTKADESLVMPTLVAQPDVTVDSIMVKRGKEETQFKLSNGVWTVRKGGAKTAIRVDTFQVKKIIDQLKSARKNDEAGVVNDPSRYDLSPPAATVELAGRNKDGKETNWTISLGKESADKAFVYCATSDRPGRVFAVPRSAVEAMLFANTNRFRSPRLFELRDADVKSFDLKEAKRELEIKREADGTWRFVKPALGFAEYEMISTSIGKEKEKAKPPAKASELNVRSLLSAILTTRVDGEDDFVVPSDLGLGPYGLADGQETLRIQVQGDAPADKKESATSETLLIGNKVPDKDQVFARMAGDDGVFKLNVKALETIEKALADPGKLRSTDMAFFDAKKVDALILKQGKEETRFWVQDGKDMKMQTGAEKPVDANGKAVEALIDTLQGKHEIQKFHGDSDALDAEFGFKTPAIEASVYVDGLVKDKDKEEIDEDAKDNKDKKDTKKEPKKDEPVFKKDVKPAVVLMFGKVEGDLVNVKRVLADGTVSRFAVPKAILDKVMPPEGMLAYLSTALPTYIANSPSALKIQRGSEKIDLVRGRGDESLRWFFKDTAPNTIPSPADSQKTEFVINVLSRLQAKKWIRKIAAGDDLSKYGLKEPSLTAILQIKKDKIEPGAVGSVSGLMAGLGPWNAVLAASTAAALREADPGESIVLKVGKETDEEKDKPGYYAQHTGTDLLFLLSADTVKLLRDTDFHDRGAVLNAEALLAMRLLGPVGCVPQAGWLLVSPLAGGQVLSFDPAKVKIVEIAIRTPFELRSFAFERAGKDKEKTWQVKSGLQDYTLDADKLTQFLKDLGDTKTERFVALDGAKADYKLGAKDFTVKIDLVMEDGNPVALTPVTLTIGAPFERLGFYAQSSAWPGPVFLLPSAKFDPLLRAGAGYFAKERVAGGS